MLRFRLPGMWLPRPPERRQLAREALGDVLDQLAERRKGVPDARGRLAARSAHQLERGMVGDPVCAGRRGRGGGRYSQIARTIAPADEEQLKALAREASTRIARLAAAVLVELGEPIDRDAVLAEAAEFLQEVDEEDDGLQHAGDALGSLLQATLVCLEERVALPGAERDRAAVAILSPLVAQAACLRWPKY
jgi:hypothetical protein